MTQNRNSSHTIMFIFGQIPLGKERTHYSLNNWLIVPLLSFPKDGTCIRYPTNIDVPLNQETKPLSENIRIFIHTFKNDKSKVGDRSRGRPECSLFNSYYTEV